MILEGFTYKPIANLKFSHKEVEMLFISSEHHYDGKCRAESMLGGTLYGLRNEFTFATLQKFKAPAYAEISLNWRKVDLFCKIAESPLCSRGLHSDLVNTLSKLSTKYDELNKET